MEEYLKQYNRALRLHGKLSKKLWEVSGIINPVYEKPYVPEHKVALVQATVKIAEECDVLIVKIKRAETISNDVVALERLTDQLNSIEEWI